MRLMIIVVEITITSKYTLVNTDTNVVKFYYYYLEWKSNLSNIICTNELFTCPFVSVAFHSVLLLYFVIIIIIIIIIIWNENQIYLILYVKMYYLRALL